jgi:hypothetical protein
LLPYIKILVTSLLLFAAKLSIAQLSNTSYSTWRHSTIAVQDTIVLDTLSLVENTLVIDNVSANTYSYNAYTSKLFFITKPNTDSIVVHYRIIPYNLSKTYSKKNTQLLSMYMGRYGNETYYEYDGNTANNSFINFGNMDYAGSLSRNINFGNNQDVVLNSNFNLQLNGMLADSLQITASITDNNVPFQPEGNTQNIQEFDRVFIQFKKAKSLLTLGDFELFKPKSYFMHFYKRVQGLYYSNENVINKNINYKYGVGASLARGKFVRLPVITIEGNQGPYKIPGPANETFLIILANSEKVFIDGVLMQRGEDKDYIIDYNNAEIIFMPRKMITKDTRLIVEYEINERNYLNSLLYTTHDVTINKKLNVYFHAYSNQDAKRQTIQQNLDAKQELFLSTIGNNINAALYPIAREDTFGSAKVMYKIIDTIVNGIQYDSIYVYSNNPDSAKYVVSYTYVGPNKGNYIITANTANGRVYGWIAPINNTPQGDYLPYLLLITPKRQQLIVAGTNYLINKNTTLLLETGLSNNDPNLFSKIGNTANLAIAQKIGLQNKWTINKKWTNNTNAQYEYVQASFNPLERFREAEFSRDWNINFSPTPANEHLGKLSIELNKTNNYISTFTGNFFIRQNLYQGYRYGFNQIANYKNWRSTADVQFTQSTFNNEIANFIRPSLSIEKTLPKLANTIVGIKCSLENNNIKNKTTQILNPQSFGFEVLQTYIKGSTAKGNIWMLNYFTRRDKLPLNNELKNINQSHNFTLGTTIETIKNQRIDVNATYRTLQVFDSAFNIKPESNLLARIDYNLRLLNNGIQYNLVYELGSGQELRREFTYIEVPIGQGTHVWNDYNSDGLQQLNEFELAQFQDQRKFIKVFTPSNSYRAAKYNLLNQTISINPKQINKKQIKNKFTKIAELFFITSSIQLNNKNVALSGLAQYNPFYTTTNDTVFISSSNTITNTIFFNRFSNKWGIDYIQNSALNKNLLTYGIDGRTNTEHAIKTRWYIITQLLLNTTFKQGNRAFSSTFLDSRVYNIHYKATEPSLTFLSKNNNHRYIVAYRYEEKINTASSIGQRAIIRAISTEYKQTSPSLGALSARASYNNISYNGDANSTLGFVMLDGLQNGNNILWLLNYDRKLGKGVEINLEYEGRKPGTASAIHTGRATVRATF